MLLSTWMVDTKTAAKAQFLNRERHEKTTQSRFSTDPSLTHYAVQVGPFDSRLDRAEHRGVWKIANFFKLDDRTHSRSFARLRDSSVRKHEARQKRVNPICV